LLSRRAGIVEHGAGHHQLDHHRLVLAMQTTPTGVMVCTPAHTARGSWWMAGAASVRWRTDRLAGKDDDPFKQASSLLTESTTHGAPQRLP